MSLVLVLHSLVRWPVLAVGVLGLVHGVLARRGGGRAWGRPLGSVFLGLLDLQLLLAILLFLRPPLPLGPPKFLHAGAMLLAVAAGHLLRIRQRRRSPEERPSLEPMVFGVPLGLILIGLAALSL